MMWRVLDNTKIVNRLLDEALRYIVLNYPGWYRAWENSDAEFIYYRCGGSTGISPVSHLKHSLEIPLSK